MSEVDRADVARAERAGVEEIRYSTLSALLWTGFAFAAVAWWRLASDTAAAPHDQWLAISITLLVLLTLGVAQAMPRLAAWMYVLIVFATAAACLTGAQEQPAAMLFAASALVAGAVVAPLAAPLVGGLGAAALWAWTGAPLPAALELVLSLGMWLALRPLYDLLWRYSRQTLEAVSMSEQLRDERGRLGRTIKDLDLSYRLLEKTNLQLALVCREADMLRDLRHSFATNLSHELRTPLNVILGFSRLIYSSPNVYGMSAWPDGLRKDLAEMQRNAGYLSRLVDDIMDLARADALALPLQREPCDLAALAREGVELVRSMAEQKGLAVRVEAQAAITPQLVDPVRIRQILFNLLTNAIRHTARGEVVVRVGEDKDEVVVAVADTGSGIEPSEMSTIFNEFYQIGRPKVEADSGKGLGLAISKRLVQLHGGRIWAESEVGQGSTFSFSLPSSQKSFSLGRLASSASLPSGSPGVLVVNDDGTASSYLRRRLEGYDFVAVAGEEDVEPALAANRPVAVIVSADPERRGSAEAVLGQLPPDLPLMACALPSAGWLTPGGGFRAVLTKPVMQESLLKAMGEAGIDGSPRTLLVVDDDRSFIQLVRRMIEAAPGPRHQVLSAYSGQEALRKAEEAQPALVLLDLVLPDMSGFEVAARMRRDERLKDTTVIAVTAATPGEDQLEAGGASFLMRRKGPFRPGELVQMIAAGLSCATGKLTPPAGTA